MAEERRQQDGVAAQLAPALSPRLHATSTSKRLHSPQPLLASEGRAQKQHAEHTGHLEAKNQETSPSEKHNLATEDSYLGSKIMPLPVRHPSAGRTRDSTSSAGGTSGVGARERSNASKMYISKSTAALDRALGGSEFLSSNSAKNNTYKGPDS